MAAVLHIEKSLDYGFIHGYFPSCFFSCISPAMAPTGISFLYYTP
jgi:hypothetical protein